jgi:hypothetical protein
MKFLTPYIKWCFHISSAVCILYLTLPPDIRAQTPLNAENFESLMIAYRPVQKPEVSDKDFNHGKMILDEMQSAVSQDVLAFNRGDYFNILSAFLTLNESEKNIQLAFEKFSSSEGACEYFIALESKVEQNKKYDPVRAQFLKKVAACKKGKPEENAFSVKAYCQEHQLNQELVRLMMEINRRDQESRSMDSNLSAAEGRRADAANQEKIDSLYQVYGQYLGRTLVGPEFETVMWAVIQHSNVEMMKRYLPVLHEAYSNNELAVGPLKMTIDRYYAISEGFQVFGSQTGFKATLADERTTNEIKRKFGIQ